MSNLVGRNIVVSGKVQGVFFRASTFEEANKLGLTGWVLNLTSGQVQIEVHGDLSLIMNLEAWCKTGPQFASVSSVVMEPIPFKEFKKFIVRY